MSIQNGSKFFLSRAASEWTQIWLEMNDRSLRGAASKHRVGPLDIAPKEFELSAELDNESGDSRQDHLS